MVSVQIPSIEHPFSQFCFLGTCRNSPGHFQSSQCQALQYHQILERTTQKNLENNFQNEFQMQLCPLQALLLPASLCSFLNQNLCRRHLQQPNKGRLLQQQHLFLFFLSYCFFYLLLLSCFLLQTRQTCDLIIFQPLHPEPYQQQTCRIYRAT